MAIGREPDFRIGVYKTMSSVARWLGLFASVTWFLLSALTATSSLLGSGLLAVNLIMAAVFGSIALLIWWRIRAVVALHSTDLSQAPLRSLLRVESVTSLAMALVGVALLVAASYRVMIEGLPVFG